MAPWTTGRLLYDPTDLIWRKGTPFEAMTVRTAPSSGFPEFCSAVRQMPGDMCKPPRIISLSPLSLVTDVTDATFGASGLGYEPGQELVAPLKMSFSSSLPSPYLMCDPTDLI
jgi:hypothetical protein